MVEQSQQLGDLCAGSDNAAVDLVGRRGRHMPSQTSVRFSSCTRGSRGISELAEGRVVTWG